MAFNSTHKHRTPILTFFRYNTKNMSCVKTSSFTDGLPTELFATIFQIRLTEELESKTIIQSPFFLGSICSHWRQVAWSTPLLWKKIIFRWRPDESRSCFLKRVELFRQHVEHATTVPMSIEVFQDLNYWPMASKIKIADLEPLVDLINSCSPYWFELSLSLPLGRRLSVNKSALSGHSYIRKFDFRVIHRERPFRANVGPSECVFDPSLIAYLPQAGLEELCIWGADIHPDFLLTTWSTLRRLTLVNSRPAISIHIRNCLRMLSKAPLLQVATFDDMDYSERPSSGHIIHRNLERLVLHRTNKSRTLSSLTLPGLRVLELNIHRGGYEPERLIALIERSRCPLEKIVFRDFGIGNLSPALQMILPGQSVPIGVEQVLEALFEDNSTPISRFEHLFPCLQEFVYQGVKHVPNANLAVALPCNNIWTMRLRGSDWFFTRSL